MSTTNKVKRRGPFPLVVHMGMATSNLAGLQDYMAQYQPALTEDDMVRMVHGIQLYHAHSYVPEAQQHRCVWRHGSLRVMTPAARCKKKGRPLLLVPSLVNKSGILDLMPERSFLRWMHGNGIPAYLLDWGDLTHAPDALDMRDIVHDYLAAAIRKISETEGGKIDVLGYCMGGTLLLPSALACDDYIEKMVLLAAPWDFHAGHPALFERVRMWSPMVLPVIDQKGVLPAQWTQALFASLDPADVVNKFSRFVQTDQDSLEAKMFVAVEDWLNDGCDLPGAVAKHCIQEWFAKNAPAKGEWLVDGRLVNPKEIKPRVLVVASENDRLVHFECAANIMGDLPEGGACLLKLACGHVGFIAGRDAVSSVWTPIYEWLQDK